MTGPPPGAAPLSSSSSVAHLLTGAYKYPPTKRDEAFSETLHGHVIKDPYRHLEDPKHPDTVAFVDSQNALSSAFIDAYPPREKFRARLTELYDYERYGCPFKRGDAHYYFYNSGLQAQSVLYRVKSVDKEGDKGEPFFDPNALSADGTVSLSTYAFSESGAYFSYGLSHSGSDWVTLYVLPTPAAGPVTHSETLEKIEWAKFTGIEWTHDEKGFFYTKYPVPKGVDKGGAGTETDKNENAMIYYHALGTPQSEDVLIHKDPAHPEWMFGAEVTDDGHYFVLTTSESCDPSNKVWIAKLADKSVEGVPDFVKVVDDFKSEYSYITNEKSVFYFKTTAGAPNSKIVTYDLDNPSEGFKMLIPEGDPIAFALCVSKTNLVMAYLKDVKHVLNVYELKSGSLINTIPLPAGSIIDSITGRKEDALLFFKAASFVSPGVTFKYDFAAKKPTVFRETQVAGGLDIASRVLVEQVFFESAGGVKVPMWIVRGKNTTLNGTNPTLLYGYGGFNISILPAFSPTWMTFILHMGGVVAVANIRGGGEYGESWYHGGRLTHKQNVFTDFQNGAKYLIAHKYTSPARLAINGGSNGGLLVGACLNQAPELFRAGVADVGVMDVVRFHKFTIGHAWTSDYGDPEVKADFEVLIKYSPVHNVQSEKPYPAVLLCTSDHDDRVVPLHSYKFMAHLQHRNPNNPLPLMIRIETKAGHGAGKPTKKRIDEATDKYSFLGICLGCEWLEQ